eukprot:5473957-Pleurochrysis_carterae.AAC.1
MVISDARRPPRRARCTEARLGGARCVAHAVLRHGARRSTERRAWSAVCSLIDAAVMPCGPCGGKGELLVKSFGPKVPKCYSAASRSSRISVC